MQELEHQIYQLNQELFEARKETTPEPVEDATFLRNDGTSVRLSELFGQHDTLILIHNMGAACPYCTLWADLFTSVVPKLQERTSFVLVSPDPPAAQAKIREKRGWNFDTVCDETGDWTRAMGYLGENGYWPGCSAFHRDADGKITRVNRTIFGPGDSFNSIWHFFSLLPGGAGDWEPS